ncbi:PAN domain-containing protein [Candidatus Viadribacter manganicus]|uniref:Apple domain-containing protein n=1 Tax=Candidatus Viadribacter manganicus TaxID=1759059 RepID=A0A1B1AEB3_9PROT|nr:PAN domain-containing protein [Candidatus Viadribacter manganicus]ANP44899.1 hypothetical protein ATE48_02655 [Candidatus Viadribacter manganicus]
MRYLASVAVLAIAQIGAAWALADNNVARPGGTYASLEAETATDCERLCTDDTLCMAWSFHANSCEFKAIVPAATPQEGIISGVSARAPASMRARFEPVPAATPTALIAEEHEALETPVAAGRPEDEISLALLGGPVAEQELRSRLGN